MFTIFSRPPKQFKPGDLVENFGVIARVEQVWGSNPTWFRLRIVACQLNGVKQGGSGQEFIAKAELCKEPPAGVKLLSFQRPSDSANIGDLVYIERDDKRGIVCGWKSGTHEVEVRFRDGTR